MERGLRRFVLTLAVVLGVIAVAAGGFGGYLWWDARVSPDITGRLVLYDADGGSGGSPCETGWLFADVYAGAPVTVRDGDSRKRVGTGRLDSGITAGDACIFSFDIANVDDAETYEIAIGAFGARSLTLSRGELERRNWHVQFVYGAPTDEITTSFDR